MSNQKTTFSVRKLAIIGLLSALVFIFSWVQIPIGQIARVHLGNVFCALSGLLFGPLVGGLSSGFGSMLFDFTNPVYIAESWITFITKFFIGFLAGLIAHRGGKAPTLHRDVLGAAVGSVTYILLYLTKSFIFMLSLLLLFLYGCTGQASAAPTMSLNRAMPYRCIAAGSASMMFLLA